MLKKCAVPVPSGYFNPSAVLPALYLFAKGHTTGKKSNQPGMLTTALGKQVSLLKLAYRMEHPTTCQFNPGQRRTPNPQRGRPRYQSQVYQVTKPKLAGVVAMGSAALQTCTVRLQIFPTGTGGGPYPAYEYANVPASTVYEWGSGDYAPNPVPAGTYGWLIAFPPRAPFNVNRWSMDRYWLQFFQLNLRDSPAFSVFTKVTWPEGIRNFELFLF